jgi:hypothetical protein
MLLTFCLAACLHSGTGENFCVCLARFAGWSRERGQLVSGCRVREAREVIAVDCGSLTDDVLIQLSFLFVWLERALCE